MQRLQEVCVSTPDKEVVRLQAWSVSLPTALGQITVLPEHEALLGQLVPGELAIVAAVGQPPARYLVHEGSFTLDQGGLTVLVQLALPAAALSPADTAAQLAAAQLAVDTLSAAAAPKQRQQALRGLRRAEARRALQG